MPRARATGADPLTAGSGACFSADSFAFLRELAEHNDRGWFDAQRTRYERVLRQPSLRLISALQERLAAISPQLVADPRPVGGSLFRIHRDTRFAKDKRPYKTHVGMRFFHAATRPSARGSAGSAVPGRLDAPLLYLHVEPGRCFVGGGIWHPQPASLMRIRHYLLGNPASWKAATRDPAFTAHYALGGERLQRVPRGYDAAHELADDLRRKDFIASRPLSDEQLCSADLPEALIVLAEPLAPLLDWLCGALDLDF